MTALVWRYSHVLLAVSSFVFVLIASVTGIILAFEPISNQLQPYAIQNTETNSVATVISVLQEQYDEVVWVEVDTNDFVSASVVTKANESGTFYINPKTGEKVGDIIEKASVFKFATNLHRSLFLKKTGRFLVALASFALFLIAVSGMFLIIKRQGSFKGFFTKIVRESFYEYYHIIVGRLSLLPIIIITFTGVYLSLEKFSVLPKDKSKHKINYDTISAEPKVPLTDFEVFKTTHLDEVIRIEFPFSDDVEDYFLLQLKDREVLVNQFTGEVLSEKYYPLSKMVSYYSLIFHTGQGSILWSLVLLLATCSILFFMYSGFKMLMKRKKKSPLAKNKWSKDEAEYIILVGSETKNTYVYANLFFNALAEKNIPAHIALLNTYASYKNAKQLIVFTATYGKGEAPSNANTFLEQLKTVQQERSISFSVVGFGSLAYADFCQFAIDVDSALQAHTAFKPLVALHKINNQSYEAFNTWLKEWNDASNINISINKPEQRKSNKNHKSFRVISRTPLNVDDTYLLRLRPHKKQRFKSGDLLGFIPEEDGLERLYSVARVDDDVLLSVKKHEFGVCSTYFSKLDEEDVIKAKLQRNYEFHFPNYAHKVLLIGNGTGIAPFLGMIANNTAKKEVHLFWGARTKASLELYKPYIDVALKNQQLTQFYSAYSQEQNHKIYVQDTVKEHAEVVVDILKNEGVIMICGSVAMQSDVLQVLGDICTTQLQQPLSDFENNEQLKMDCY